MSLWHIYGKSLSTSELRAKAEKVTEKLKKDAEVSPVVIEGKQIAVTFWGKSWCQNLEAYQDLSNRLDRGRSYVRHGAVVDLKIKQGEISAQVSGSSLYKCKIEIAPLSEERWIALQRDCSGKVSSLLELLQGRLSKEVMAVLCKRPDGIFPAPSEISFRCSCPDGAIVCKHIAAVLYGVGNRLDKEPSLLFLLRSAKEQELIGKASIDALLDSPQGDSQTLDGDLAAIFGVDFVSEEKAKTPLKAKVKVVSAKAAKKPAAKKPSKKRAAKKRASPAKKTAKKNSSGK